MQELITPAALKGRFLHITDFHPDPHYKTGATLESGCHRRPKPDKGKARAFGERNEDVEDSRVRGKERFAGKWGTEVS